MTEHDRAGRWNDRGIGRRLRLEACRTRPAFSTTLQERIIEDAVRELASDLPRRSPRAGRVAALACIAFAAWLPARGPWLASSSPGVVAAEPSLDELPSLEEIGDAWTQGTAALAAEAVGLPGWNDLVDAGRFVGAPRDPVP